ncbi:MAG: hypothetical protein ACYTGZ_06125 [Planctomycetota bacterium]
MTASHTRILATLFVAFAAVACGLPISESKPLTYVAPLEGTWINTSDPDVEFRFIIPGGQDLFAPQFSFTAEMEDVSGGAVTTYAGTADADTFELRDPGTGALLLTGQMVLDGTELFELSDGSIYSKPFVPNLLTGTWVDVNFPDREYRFESQDAVTASGCAEVLEATKDDPDLDGNVNLEYDGEDITEFRVDKDDVIRVLAGGRFFGASAMRINRVGGFLHLQRVDKFSSCP